jgi:hypothetical protein
MSSVNNASTLIIGIPSIGQQRITVLIFLLIIGALAWWQDTGNSSDHRVQKLMRTPLPDVIAQLDFTSAEASWSGLRMDQKGNLEINGMTQAALADAIALIDGDASESKMARIALLLEKQFGATTSQQIMELLPALEHYGKVERRWWEENGSRNPPAYEELFQLQDDLLGKDLAKKLFAEQRRLTKMMLASQQIHNDPSLTQAQKEQALMDLQRNFERGELP